ncbi:MAG: class I adenylate-forming enzyme family protein [Burkholderiaceae bacterium]
MSNATPTAEQVAQDPPFQPIADLVAAHARRAPTAPAVVDATGTLDYGSFDALIDRVASALQRDGVRPGEAVAICAASSAWYAAVFLGTLRAGAVLAPLAPSVTPAAFAAMLHDCGARLLFIDDQASALLDELVDRPGLVALQAGTADAVFERWLTPVGTRPRSVAITPEMPFNIIYSSGTTGTPKGIVQSHGMRWTHVMRGPETDHGPETVTLLATPLYSNTTLVTFFPTLAWGGRVVLMDKFNAGRYLELSETQRVTHTMLVPVQYQRLLAHPSFGRTDLSSFRLKFCTSAPFSATLKAEVLERWPGGLIEYYGMTEGGGSCVLVAHEHPDKLHTVGQPVPGHKIRMIGEDGREVACGEIGEVVGRSAAMMLGYFHQPGKTAESEWFDAEGNRFIRTGDVGRFDADGFLTLMDRRKDMIISGGFNVYPSDLEAVLCGHAAVAEAAVVGMPSEKWGETPVAWVVPRSGAAIDGEALREWANQRLGKTQRMSALHFTNELPRSAIGKVLKTELCQRRRP